MCNSKLRKIFQKIRDNESLKNKKPEIIKNKLFLKKVQKSTKKKVLSFKNIFFIIKEIPKIFVSKSVTKKKYTKNIFENLKTGISCQMS